MKIIEITAQENGGHRNQSYTGFVPEGYALLPDTVQNENFPFGEVTVEEIDGVPTVTAWTPLPMPEPEPEPPSLDERVAALEVSLATLTYSLRQLSESVQEVIKIEDIDMPSGDYLNPIAYTSGMSVTTGLFYTDGDDIWESIKDGVPSGFEDAEYFDIIIV